MVIHSPYPAATCSNTLQTRLPVFSCSRLKRKNMEHLGLCAGGVGGA